MVERVVAHGFDGVENGEAAAAEHFEVDAEAAVDHFCQRSALRKENAGAGDQIFHQADVAFVEAALDDVGFGEAVRCGDVERDVDAAFFEVALNVLPEIRELESGAGGVGHRLALFVAIAAEIKDEASNRIRGIDAIADHGIPGRITLYVLILAEGLQQIGERLLGNILGDVWFRAARRRRDAMGGRRSKHRVRAPTNRAVRGRALFAGLRRRDRRPSGNRRRRL